MKKITLFLIVFLALKNFSSAGETFSDIAGHQYQNEIEYIASLGIVQGYADGTYQPDSPINRAELLKIVMESNNFDMQINKSKYLCFSDVPRREWYTIYVCSAKEKGIINGYPDGEFKPANNINFVEALKIIELSYGAQLTEEADPWYQFYLDEAEQYNMIPPNLTDHGQLITRGQVAYMISNYLIATEGEDGIDDQLTGSTDGYILITPLGDQNVYLINKAGELARQWTFKDKIARSAYLLPDGRLVAPYHVRTEFFNLRDFAGGGIAIQDWEGNEIWSYELSNEQYSLHHDIAIMPNGNILAIAYERLENAEATDLGFVIDGYNEETLEGEVWLEVVFEINSEKEIVWEWYAKDHLIGLESTADREAKALLNVTYPENRLSPDWSHLNAIDYNSELDQIILSSFMHHEIFIIDHSISTAEAAGPAGDLLWRWGNPALYGSTETKLSYGQHNAHWIDPQDKDSNILLFNNGDPHTRPYSAVIELDLNLIGEAGNYSYEDLDDAAEIVWEYGDDSTETQFFSYTVSGAQRLENGNTLICSGMEERILEIDAAGELIWDFTNTDYGAESPTDNGRRNDLFRAEGYSQEYIEGILAAQN